MLLTGPGGLGLAVLDALARAGAGGEALSRSGAAALPEGWRPRRADLTDPESLRGTCDGFDVVLHFAALTHSNTPAAYRRVNVEGTRNLIDAARAARVGHFLYASSRAIDPRGGAYSRSKAEAEALVRDSALPWTIVRPAEVYGVGSEGLARVLELARAGRRVPTVGDGRWRLSPVFVADVAEGVRAAALRPAAGRVYHLVGPEEMTFRELVARLGRHYGTDARPFGLPGWLLVTAARALALARVPHPPIYVDQVARLLAPKPYDLEPAATELGYRPRNLEEGLAALLASGQPRSR